MKKLILLLLLSSTLAFGQNKSIDSLNKALVTAKADTLKADIYFQLAVELLGMDPVAAQKIIDKQDVLSKKINYKTGLVNSYLLKAMQGSFTGNFEALKENSEKGLALSTKYNMPISIATFHNSLGIYYWQTGNYAEAIKNHLAALKIREYIKDETGIAKSLGNIGQVYLDDEKLKEAESYSLKCLVIAKKIKNNYILINAMHILANTYSAQKKYMLALKFDEEALVICIGDNNKRGLSQIYSNMALCYARTGQYDKALKYQLNVLAFDQFFGDQKQESDTYLNIGEIYMHKNQYDEAIGQLKKSLMLSTKAEYKKGQKSVWKMLSTIYEKKGNYKEALTAQQKYQAINEEEINESNDKAIALIQTQYGTQKKEQQINLLNKENTIQKLSIANRNKTIGFITGLFLLASIAGLLYYNRYKLKQKTLMQQQEMAQQEHLTQAIITAEEKERKRIASDLHDGVGQMFSAVKMNLDGLLERVKIDREEDRFLAEKTIALVDESCKEVRAISHQMMPNMLLRSGIASDVKSFIEMIDSEKLKVNVEAIGFKDRLESNVEIVLYRVIQESVNNVIKHAKATLLEIKLVRDKESISVVITDNGIGFNTALKDDFEGIGLKNIATRIEYLKGTVNYISAPGTGTSVNIRVPVI